MDWVSLVPWGLTALGIGVNFWFNVVNLRRTTAFKDQAVRLDEFKRLRGTLDATLADLLDQRLSLVALELSRSADDEIRTEIEEVYRAISGLFPRLEDRLKALDASSFAEGEDWHVSVSPLWDEFVQAIDRTLSSARPPGDLRVAIGVASAKLGAIGVAVNGRLDRELTTHAMSLKRR